MTRNKCCYRLCAVLLLISIIVLAAGCITLYEKKPADSKPGSPATPTPGGAPVIKSFTALPGSINSGQQSQLQWEITGASSVDISPVVGKVGQSDTVLVTPTATTTYTLVATNAAGSSSKSTVTVTVAGAATTTKRPDLIVTDISLITSEVYYKAKNIGTAASKGSRTYLFVNGLKQADDYLEILEPGQERITPFKNYAWAYTISDFSSSFSPDAAPRQFTVKACVDVENVVVESDEANNCMTSIWGEKYVYNFLSFAHQAIWTTGYGVLKLPLPEDSANGAALTSSLSLEDNQGYGAVLLAVPQQVSNGFIQGLFSEFYTDELRQTRLRNISIPDMAKFTARVGFATGTPPNSKAKFMFGTIDDSGQVTFSQTITAANDGKLDLYEVDLGKLAAQKRSFILRVEAIGSAEKMRPVWVEPRIYQP